MALVGKKDVVDALARMYTAEAAAPAIKWVKKQPALDINDRGDAWSEHIAEAARGEEGELTRAELARRCIDAVASEIVECGLYKQEVA